MNAANDHSTRRNMRHSAWTLWLVPLVLPLVLLLVPGSRSPIGQPEAPVESYELLQEEELRRTEFSGASLRTPDVVADEASEALLKD
jgi:hypothetical protein